LGDGIYFWEENPGRALQYAQESAQRKQFNLVPVTTPFVLGAIIDLGNCLNLVEAESLRILGAAYEGSKATVDASEAGLLQNKGNNRALDCAIFKYIHHTNSIENKPGYDTVRCAFPEGEEAYPNSSVTSRLHIQVAVRNPECIKGIFLPLPNGKFNPF
jgi:hypothetical protein